MDENEQSQDRILHPHEVAKMARVDPKTVTRWEKAGKLTAFRTLGGHRRYRESDVLAALALANEKPEQEES